MFANLRDRFSRNVAQKDTAKMRSLMSSLNELKKRILRKYREHTETATSPKPPGLGLSGTVFSDNP